MSQTVPTTAPVREDIVTLAERIEAIKEADPRYRGTVDEVISLFCELEAVARAAGWTLREYEVTLASAML